MPRDSGGHYSLPLGNPVIDDTLIETTWANPTMSDIAAQLDNVLTRDGLLGTVNPLGITDGTVANPGLYFNSEPGSGLFKSAAHILNIAVAGVVKATFNDTGLVIPGTLAVTGGVTLAGPTVLTLALGTAALPSLAFTGDPNTGIFSPGSDQIALVTGGAQKLYISNAQAILGVPATINVARSSGANATVMTLADSVTGSQTPNFGTRLQWSSNAGGTLAAIGFEVGGLGDNNQSQLAFYTQPSATGLVQRMLIGKDGNVTINAPSSGFHQINLLDSGNPSILFAGATKAIRIRTSTTEAYVECTDQTGVGSYQQLNLNGSNLVFETAHVPRMTISSAGNVTVNAPTTGETLVLKASPTADALKMWGRAVDGIAGIYFANNSGTTQAAMLAYSDGKIEFYNNLAGSIRLTIGSAGDIINNVNGLPPALTANQTMVWQLSSNTNLRVIVRGSDGVSRVANLTLA